jgi:putative NADPH-quinone reductase
MPTQKGSRSTCRRGQRRNKSHAQARHDPARILFPRGQHFGHALADAYAAGARTAGHEIKCIEVAKLDFPLLRSSEEFYQGPTPEGILPAQAAIRWADHLVLFYPLWHGHFPALLQAFLEQTFRPGFAVESRKRQLPKKLFVGKTARIVVTMGSPAFFYHWFYRAHSLKSLKRNILGFAGISPITTTLIGWLGGGAGEPEGAFPTLLNKTQLARRLDKLRALGRQGR